MKLTQTVSTLPGYVYTDPNIFNSELEAIYSKTWQYICHIENLGNPGDYISVDIANEKVFLICGEDRKIRGFFNVCSHRASRLLEGTGCARRISCPYHGWTYNTQGDLVAAPNATQVPGFDQSRYGLPEFSVEVVNGLVFANIDSHAEPFREFAPGLLESLEEYAPGLGDLTFVHRTEAHLSGNWKVAVENFAECYHCELLHPSLVNGILEFDTYRVRLYQHWHKHESGAKKSAVAIYQHDQNNETEPGEFAGLWMWPNFAFQNYPGGAVHVWKWTPIDTTSTHVTVDWFFKSTDLKQWEKDLISHHAENTFAEDIPIIAKVQSGLSSGRYRPGPLMVDKDRSQLSEHGVADIQKYWRTAMRHTEGDDLQDHEAQD